MKILPIKIKNNYLIKSQGFQHATVTVPFREFDSDRPEEKVKRFPVRFFEKNLCAIVAYPVC